jgi:hypothetical protein
MAASNAVKIGNGDGYRDVIKIAKHDTTNIAADATNNPLAYPIVNGIQVTVTGNFALVVQTSGSPASETVITVTGAPVGTIFDFPVKRINSTNTTGEAVGLIR